MISLLVIICDDMKKAIHERSSGLELSRFKSQDHTIDGAPQTNSPINLLQKDSSNKDTDKLEFRTQKSKYLLV
jgi:hypothetical protein